MNNTTKITLQREILANYSSLFGTLTVKTDIGEFKFATVEHYGLKIKEGIYNLSYTHSPKFGKGTYEVVGVPKRFGIRIHSANRGIQLEGCIAIGIHNHTTEIPAQLYQSKLSIEQLEKLLRFNNHRIEIKEIPYEKDSIKDIRVNSPEVVGALN